MDEQIIVDEDFISIEEIENRKEISLFGGIALLVNNITGPGLITIPLAFQQAGWFIPILIFGFIMISSSLAATMLCKAMSKVRGNETFQGRVEFCTLAKHFLPKWGFIITTGLLVISLMSFLVSSIVISAQTMDLAIIAIFSRSYSLEIYPSPGIAICENPGDQISPFGSIFGLSIGYTIVMILTIPFGFFHLHNNIIIQNVAFVLLGVIMLDWFVNFGIAGLQPNRLPMFGSQMNTTVGTVIFNYSFVTTIPSWVNQKKKKSVSINKSVWISNCLATVMFVSIGIFGALAFDFGNTDDLLSVINTSTTGINHYIAQVCVYLFPIAALLSSIPVFSIVIRYNLIENKICRKSFALFWSVIFPWVISIIFYTGAGLFELINWASLLVNGFVNFVIPMILFVLAIRKTFDGYTWNDTIEELKVALPTEDSLSIEGITCDEEKEDLDFQEIMEVETPRTSAEVETPRISAEIETPRISAEVETPTSSAEFQVLPKKLNEIIVALILSTILTIILLVVIGLNIVSVIT